MDRQVKDVFLSHTATDKEAYVRPFARELDKHGITYWLDEAEIRWGDKITRKINAGLGKSRYVVVFLSDSFLGRNWPEAELDAALNKETSDGRTIVLPLLIGNPEEIFNQYPLLRDKLFLEWNRDLSSIVDNLESLLSAPPPQPDAPLDYRNQKGGSKSVLGIMGQASSAKVLNRSVQIKLGLVLGSLAASNAIIGVLRGSPRTAPIGIILFVLLLLILVWRAQRNPLSIGFAQAISYFLTGFGVTVLMVMITSVFFAWPRPLNEYHVLGSASSGASPTPLPSPVGTATPLSSATPIHLSVLIASAKRVFWIDYPHQPDPGQRYWLQLDDYTWIERYADGTETTFRVTGDATVGKVHGTLVLKIRGDQSITLVPDDGSFQVFIPDKRTRSQQALFRHFIAGSWEDWSDLGTMNTVK